VAFGGQPAALPDREIEALRHGLAREMRLEPYPYLKVGQRVRVTSQSACDPTAASFTAKAITIVVTNTPASTPTNSPTPTP